MNYLESEYFTRYKDYNTEKFDVEAYDMMIEKQKGRRRSFLDDGTVIIYNRPYFKELVGSGEKTSNGSIDIYPSHPFFYDITKIYDAETKILISQGVGLENQMVGIFQEFNKHGKLIKEIDYEKKDWSKYHYQDVLKFLDEKKVINLKTGEGRGAFTFYLDNESEKWHIEITEALNNGFVATLYTLDANTLKVLEVEKEQRGIE